MSPVPRPWCVWGGTPTPSPLWVVSTMPCYIYILLCITSAVCIICIIFLYSTCKAPLSSMRKGRHINDYYYYYFASQRAQFYWIFTITIVFADFSLPVRPCNMENSKSYPLCENWSKSKIVTTSKLPYFHILHYSIMFIEKLTSLTGSSSLISSSTCR